MTGQRGSASDYGWLVFIAVIVVGLVVSFGRMLYLIATERQLGSLIPLPIGLACAAFLIVVAWRQTVWSEPGEDDARREAGSGSTETAQ